MSRERRKHSPAFKAKVADQRQLVLPFPLSHRKSCGRNRRPTAHCGLHCPQLRVVSPAYTAIMGLI